MTNFCISLKPYLTPQCALIFSITPNKKGTKNIYSELCVLILIFKHYSSLRFEYVLCAYVPKCMH